MNNKKYVFFDLDGTLTDPKEGITKSVQYSLKSFGIEVPDRRVLYPFIGPPLRDSYIKYYGFPREKAEEAIAKYREYFTVTGIFENEIYYGIPQLLKEIKESGRVNVLATSKPHVFAKKILKHFEIYHLFDFVAGSELDGKRSDKTEIIEYALNAGGFKKPQTIMVGDRSFDIAGAKNCGISSVGVLYGYGSKTELDAAGADFIAANVDELREVLFNFA